MKTIAIPPDIFLSRVRREYSNCNDALIREFIQNSCDAKATRVDFVYDENLRTLTVTDNGRGIVPELVEEALFVLGGSVKDTDAIGGMGAAKELCFFAHPRYRIDTLTTTIVGEGPTYRIEQRPESFPGFQVEITFDPSWGISLWALQNSFNRICSVSDLKIEVTFNGARIPASFNARPSKLTVPLGKVFTKATADGEEANKVYVRVKGLVMFAWHLRRPTKRHLLLEITKPSTEVLTQNRDGFRGEAQETFSKWIDELSTARSSYGNDEPRIISVDGYAPEEPTTAVPSDTTSTPHDEPDSRQTDSLQDSVTGVETVYAGPPLASAAPVPKSRLRQRFHINLDGCRYTKVPKCFHPAHVSGQTLWLIKAWAWAIQHVKTANALTLPTELGFTFNSDHAAAFSRPYRHEQSARSAIRVCWINPTSPKFRKWSRYELVSYLITLAAHELAHESEAYHTDAFIASSEVLASRAHAERGPLGRCLREIQETHP